MSRSLLLVLPLLKKREKLVRAPVKDAGPNSISGTWVSSQIDITRGKKENHARLPLIGMRKCRGLGTI